MRRPWSAAWIRGAALALVLGLGTGCGSDSEAAGTGGTGALDGEVVVFAAASLTDAFQELGERFEADHPGTTVTFNFAGSATLAQQIVAGAPADVFAAASPQAMAMVEEAGLAEPELFARNRLQIAVPSGNPAGVTGLADFAREELRIALCAEPAPCGAAAVRAFEAAGITPAPDTYEQDVRAALSLVALGEVDAALVYHTDVIAAGDDVEGIDFPEAAAAVNDYPISVLEEAPNPDAAWAFVDLVLSDTGRAVLETAGFDVG